MSIDLRDGSEIVHAQELYDEAEAVRKDQELELERKFRALDRESQ